MYQLINTKTGEIVHTVNSRAVYRLTLAERRANRRDFDLRYGSNRRHPHGVSPARRPGRQPKLIAELATAVGIVVGAYACMALLFSVM